jgi:ankyrin repeat protein
MNQAWQTPLMAAASKGDERAVKDFIARKANVNAASEYGMTALMYAQGLPVVRLLLGAGASVREKDVTGKTALHYGVQRADPGVVRALIRAGANVNAQDNKGMSPLQVAKLELHSENFSDKSLRDAYASRVQRVIKLLVKSGASQNGL